MDVSYYLVYSMVEIDFVINNLKSKTKIQNKETKNDKVKWEFE